MEIPSNISPVALICSPPSDPGNVLHHSLHCGSWGNWDRTCDPDVATPLAAPKSLLLACVPYTVVPLFFPLALNVIIYYYHLFCIQYLYRMILLCFHTCQCYTLFILLTKYCSFHCSVSFLFSFSFPIFLSPSLPSFFLLSLLPFLISFIFFLHFLLSSSLFSFFLFLSPSLFFLFLCVGVHAIED